MKGKSMRGKDQLGGGNGWAALAGAAGKEDGSVRLGLPMDGPTTVALTQMPHSLAERQPDGVVAFPAVTVEGVKGALPFVRQARIQGAEA